MPILDAAIPAVSALLGVAVGGILQSWQATSAYNRQRADKGADDALADQRAKDALAERRAFAAYRIAEQLEAFAKACAAICMENRAEEVLEGAARLPPFPAWAADMPWAELGAQTTARVRDFGSAVDLVAIEVSLMVHHAALDVYDAADFQNAGAGRLGLRAAELARSLRVEAGLPELEVPTYGRDFIDVLEREVAKDEARQKRNEEAEPIKTDC